MLSRAEAWLQPTGPVPGDPPPEGLARFYWHYVRQARWLVLALFAAGLATALLDSAIPLFIGRLVTLLSAGGGLAGVVAHWRLLLAMAVVLLVARPAALGAQYLVSNQAMAAGLTNLVRWQSHWHVVRQSLPFFQDDFAGRIANRVMQTGPSLRESVVSATNAVWYILVYGGSAAVLLARSDWRLALPVLLWFAAYACLLRVFVPRLRGRSRAVSEARSGLTGRVVDSYTNILTVKLFARARDEDRFVADAVDEHTSAYRAQLRQITGLSLCLAGQNALLLAGTGALAVWLWGRGAIAVGTVATALPLAWQISNMSGWVAQSVTALFDNLGTVSDGMRSIAVPWGQPDPPDARPLRPGPGAIRFEAVRFSYGREAAQEREAARDGAAGGGPGGWAGAVRPVGSGAGAVAALRRPAGRDTGATAIPTGATVWVGAASVPTGPRAGVGRITAGGVLRNLELEVGAGERVGLVGRSGAGKSTLVGLLLRFHSPEGGRISIDGQDIAAVSAESLRARIAVVTQDTSLLHRSIGDNIRYGRPDATEAMVREAAGRAHALEFIDTLVDWQGRRGLDAHVGERGVKLSGGQRQRIAIARVVLKDAPILVLDEATSALDSEVEAAIQEQLEGLMANRTVIAIAHRLSTLSRMDRLVVLEGGRVAQSGSHAALLASGGPYARLWERQSGGFAALPA